MIEHLSAINEGREEGHAQGGLAFGTGGKVALGFATAMLGPEALVGYELYKDIAKDLNKKKKPAKAPSNYTEHAQGGLILGFSHGGMVPHLSGGGKVPGFSLGGSLLSALVPGYAIEQSITKGTHSWLSPITYLTDKIHGDPKSHSNPVTGPGNFEQEATGGYISRFASGGLVGGGSRLAFSGGGAVGDNSSISLSRGFAEGGVASSSKGDTHVSHHYNMRMQFAPTVNGKFNVEEQGEQFFSFMKSKLLRSGVNLG
jgi:hypothetical protein